MYRHCVKPDDVRDIIYNNGNMTSVPQPDARSQLRREYFLIPLFRIVTECKSQTHKSLLSFLYKMLRTTLYIY